MQEYLATFIINDNVHLAKQLDADGVHLGLSDEEARLILGKTKIIGGTANTLKMLQRTAENCDYIGLGPYQFTTKQHLSPILGLEGYRSIIEQMKAKHPNPIYAIGGITLEH
jgi:thiamine-phosphate pyrophosphorylase